MHNFIGQHGDAFDAYWVIHGTPLGAMANYASTDPKAFMRYANFHTPDDKHIIPRPSEPGEKFIKEEIPGIKDGFAYTLLHTGIYECKSTRPGSNYGAITIVAENIEGQKLKNFEQDLKKWFTQNILNNFTSAYNKNGWLRWNNEAIKLFNGKYDEQLKNSIQSLIQPYISIQNSDLNQESIAETKTNKFNDATKKLQEEIAKLEKQKQDIEKQLVEKYAQLEKWVNKERCYEQ